MATYLDRITESGISRRGFLGASIAATAALGMAGSMLGCSPQNELEASDETVVPEGKWVTAGCNYDCGCRCLNKAYVVDGIVVRQKTDDTHEDTLDHPQQRACVRGRSQRAMVFSADKLKYPMKRKSYEFGGGDKSLRGADEWERISWDEAMELVAAELKSAKENYGNESILFPNFWPDPAIAISNVLNHFGGYVSGWTPVSFGSYYSSPFFGMELWITPINDRFDFLKTETVVMLGINPAWSSPGNGFYYFQRVKDAGANFISVDPFYNDSAAALDAEWMPIRVGTDAALLLGVAHVLITEDDPETNPLIDWEFLRSCSIGFDETMMPESVDERHNFKDYVLGSLDGTAKTPEWAYDICGLEPERIRSLAYAIGKDKKVSILSGYANGRTSESDSLPQLLMTIGAMTGHFGKPGHNCGATCHRININGGPFLYSLGTTGLPYYGATLSVASGGSAVGFETPIKKQINLGEVWDAVLTGKAYANEAGGMGPNEMAEFDFHVIANFMGNAIETIPGGDKAIEAYRKVDFAFSVAQYPCGSALYSDVILPVTTFWENVGFISELGTRDAVIACQQVIEPLYEAKTPTEIALMLADKLGVDTHELFPFGEKQAYFNQIASTTVVDSDGKTSVPLATVTQEDLDSWGVEGEPQEGKIAFSELMEKGIYQFDLKPDDNYTYIAYKDFVEDPEKNPLATASGKFEIYSEAHAAAINQLGYSEVDPLPFYAAGPEGYQETFSDWESKTKGEYPYQIYSIHYMGKAHTNFANNAWCQEAFAAPVYMNSQDAAGSGIADGDAVLVESKHGKILRSAYVTDRLMPGVTALPHGGWKDLNAQGIDEGGNDNSLCGTPVTGFGVNAFNSVLVRITKWDEAELSADCEKPRRVLVEG